MRRFFDYYRQFDELPPEEVSRELRSRRDAERAVVGVPALDLSGAGWHEPPHPEVVNAATFALRRRINRYPEMGAGAAALAIAAHHGVPVERVALGHGAGQLLQAAPWPSETRSGGTRWCSATAATAAVAAGSG